MVIRASGPGARAADQRVLEGADQKESSDPWICLRADFTKRGGIRFWGIRPNSDPQAQPPLEERHRRSLPSLTNILRAVSALDRLPESGEECQAEGQDKRMHCWI